MIELSNSTNPFAVIIVAHLTAIQSKQNYQDRLDKKIAITRSLYEKGFNKADILNLYTFIDWVIHIPISLAIEYNNEISRFEEQNNMPYITTAERLGFEKGIEQGIETGIEKGELLILCRLLTKKFGELPGECIKKLQNTHSDQLLKFADRILIANTLDEIFI